MWLQKNVARMKSSLRGPCQCRKTWGLWRGALPCVLLASLLRGAQAGTESSTAGEVLLRASAGALRGQLFRLPDGSRGSRFLGIRYAKPPTKNRRFRAPVAAEPWQDVYDATKFGPSCYQPHMFDVWMMAQQPNRSFGSASVQHGVQQPWLYLVQDYLLDVSEDCLSLNVYTPFVKSEATAEVNGRMRAEWQEELNSDWLSNENFNKSSANSGSVFTQPFEFMSEGSGNPSHVRAPPNPRLPVMVYIHGGSYFGNAGRLYPGEKLASTGMVVVTLNYRLGAFGFLSTGDSSASGNWGLLDQRLALRWVQEHIASFGGDPAKVLLAGNSAGGASVLLHLLSPGSAGLFSRVAAMSGSALGPWAIQRQPRKFARRLARSLACDRPSSQGIVDCLRRADALAILTNFTEQLADGLWISFAAVVEGEDQPGAFLPRHPYEVLLEGRLPTAAPVFLTVTTDEVSIWYRGNQDELKVFQVENWISKIVKNIYSPLELGPENLAAVIHSVRGEYLYSRGYEPSLVRDLPDALHDHPAYVPTDAELDWHHSSNRTAPVSIISELISDVGLLVPCVEEAGLLSRLTSVYLAQFAFVSPDDIKIQDQRWIGAYHEHELQYLFGLPYWHLKNTLRHPSNKVFSDIIMTVFRQFAEQGHPNGPDSSESWPLYRRPGDALLSVGLNSSVKYNFLLDRVAFWKKFIPLLTKWPMRSTSAAASALLSPQPTYERALARGLRDLLALALVHARLPVVSFLVHWIVHGPSFSVQR